MKNAISAAVVLTIIFSTTVWAETRSGSFTGQLTGTTVESTGKTTVLDRRADQEAWTDHGPMAFDGTLTFTWDEAARDSVAFKGDINMGDWESDTHAKVAMMNIKSTQSFHGFVHHMEGNAQWDPASRTLVYSHPLDTDDNAVRDAGGASTVSQSRDAECKEADSRACKAFFATSTELEGLEMTLTFSNDLNTFEGKLTMIQFGGSNSRLERSQSWIGTSISGTLE